MYSEKFSSFIGHSQANMELASKVVVGDVSAAAKLLNAMNDEALSAIEELKSIYPQTGRAYIIGITGASGVGKSVLVGVLISLFRRQGMTVGVVAVDPTSPFTGGAILGDRIRMSQHNMDKDVFIRSVATRGCEGGISRAAIATIQVMDAMNKDIILVESVGVGQTGTKIGKIADTSIVMLTPEAGDEIQIMKAGILEIADIFVINKADREGANALKREIEIMIRMKAYPRNKWQPTVFLTEATCGKGTEELSKEIMRHREFLISSGGLEKCRRERVRSELIEAVEGFLKSYIYQRIDKYGYLEKLVDDLMQRKTDPYSAALKICQKIVPRVWKDRAIISPKKG